MMTKIWLSLMVLAALAGCGGGSTKVGIGKYCQLDSECQSGLSCSFSLCMTQCQAQTDCPVGQQCVKNASGGSACLLTEIEICDPTTPCRTPLVCAVDWKCRNRCFVDSDCATSTQRCVLPEGVCAEPTAIDPTTGQLQPAGGRDGGVADSAPADAPTPGMDSALGLEAGTCTLAEPILTLPEVIATNLTLPYQPGCRYRVRTQVWVEKGATLTIAPGVVVDADAGLGITVKGALSAAGTAELPIRFAGTQATPGFWKGISFESSDSAANVLDHVIIENAGTMAASGGILPGSLLIASSRVQLRNTTVRGGSGVGLGLSAPILDDFAGNVFTQNAMGAVNVDSSAIGQLLDSPPSSFSGNSIDAVLVDGDTVSTDATWPALDVPYLVKGEVEIKAKVTLQAGTRLRMGQRSAVFVRSATGALLAQGTASKPITLSGEQPTPGYWTGICFDNSDNVSNILDYVTVENAGTCATLASQDLPASILILASRAQIMNTVVRQGSGVGMTLKDSKLDAFEGNTLTQNTRGAAYLYATAIEQLAGKTPSSFAGNEVNYVVVNGGNISTAQTWPALDVGYLFFEPVTVGAALTIAAGATLVFRQDRFLEVTSLGSLTAQGLSGLGKQITFTGEQASPGSWGGLWFSSTKSAANILDYTVVSYGGGRDTGSASRFPANVNVFASQLKVTNSTISNSKDYGIYWDADSTVTQTGNTFTGNLVDHP